jgi:hypothetical protein
MLPALSQDLRCGADRASSADHPSSYLRPSAIRQPALGDPKILSSSLSTPARIFPDRSTGSKLPNNATIVCPRRLQSSQHLAESFSSLETPGRYVYCVNGVVTIITKLRWPQAVDLMCSNARPSNQYRKIAPSWRFSNKKRNLPPRATSAIALQISSVRPSSLHMNHIARDGLIYIGICQAYQPVNESVCVFSSQVLTLRGLCIPQNTGPRGIGRESCRRLNGWLHPSFNLVPAGLR